MSSSQMVKTSNVDGLSATQLSGPATLATGDGTINVAVHRMGLVTLRPQVLQDATPMTPSRVVRREWSDSPDVWMVSQHMNESTVARSQDPAAETALKHAAHHECQPRHQSQEQCSRAVGKAAHLTLQEATLPRKHTTLANNVHSTAETTARLLGGPPCQHPSDSRCTEQPSEPQWHQDSSFFSDTSGAQNAPGQFECKSNLRATQETQDRACPIIVDQQASNNFQTAERENHLDTHCALQLAVRRTYHLEHKMFALKRVEVATILPPSPVY